MEDDISIDIGELTKMFGEITTGAEKMPRGRAKKKVAKELGDATIKPVANGWMVSSTDLGKMIDDVYVFEDIDKAFEFVKSRLRPTVEQGKFLDNV